jgi:hypothetical protein
VGDDVSSTRVSVLAGRYFVDVDVDGTLFSSGGLGVEKRREEKRRKVTLCRYGRYLR